MSRCYISGPMTGKPNFNYHTFDAAEVILTAEGWEVVNPTHNFGGEQHHPGGRAAYMRLDFAHVLSVDALFVLHDWELSRGARAEVLIAQELGLPVYNFETRELIRSEVVTHVR